MRQYIEQSEPIPNHSRVSPEMVQAFMDRVFSGMNVVDVRKFGIHRETVGEGRRHFFIGAVVEIQPGRKINSLLYHHCNPNDKEVIVRGTD